MSIRNSSMLSWPWTWRYAPTGSCWREKSRGMCNDAHRFLCVVHKLFHLSHHRHQHVSLCRLRLSPSPPPTRAAGSRSSTSGALSRSIHHSAQNSPAKRRRPNDTDSEASSFAGGAVSRTRITQQASASGRVTVDEVDLDGKYVRLSNKADEVRWRSWRWTDYITICNVVYLNSDVFTQLPSCSCRIRIWGTGR